MQLFSHHTYLSFLIVIIFLTSVDYDHVRLDIRCVPFCLSKRSFYSYTNGIDLTNVFICSLYGSKSRFCPVYVLSIHASRNKSLVRPKQDSLQTLFTIQSVSFSIRTSPVYSNCRRKSLEFMLPLKA